MKAIKINTIVNLNNGLQVQSGSISVISEGLAQLFLEKEDLIPAQIVSNVYSSVTNYENGKAPIDGNSIADFNPAMYNLQLSVENYKTKTAEDLLINAVYDSLNLVYPNDCEIIEIVKTIDTGQI